MESGKFANSKRRMIQMSAKGVPFVMTSAGKKSYGPKAMFKKNADGALRKLKATNSVPKKLAPARMPAVRKAKAVGGPRKMRSNAGVKRGPSEATLYRMVFGSARMPGAPRKKRSNAGKKRTLVSSPGGTYKGRAAATRRKASGARRKLLAQNPFASLMR